MQPQQQQQSRGQQRRGLRLSTVLVPAVVMVLLQPSLLWQQLLCLHQMLPAQQA
jgi:hypothetical protein